MKTVNRRGKRYARNLEFNFVGMAESRLGRRMSELLARPVTLVLTDNTNVMLSFSCESAGRRKKTGRIELRLHHMFRKADDKTIKALASYIRTQDRESSARLDEFIKNHKQLVRKINNRHMDKINPYGKHHNLKDIYRRLNDTYFDGKINVAITWGRRIPKKHRSNIRLGSYSYENKIIRIHPNLDKNWVPRYFVESVVYHEMLHAYSRVTRRNGQSQYHTPEFRQLEARHRHYEQSRQWEKLNIHRLI